MNNENEENAENRLDDIKGDNIGSTMYSERFVLKTLISLQNIDWDDNHESNLSTLWDMTIDRDVAIYLVDHNFFDILISSIQNNMWENVRLVEILVGITSNICSQDKVIDKLFHHNIEVLHYLLRLVSYQDACTLEQLMRLFQVISRSQHKQQLHIEINKIDEFLDGLVFIINDCTKLELLISVANFIHSLAYDETDDGVDTSIDYIFSIPPFFNSIANFIKTSVYFQNINNENLKINYAYYQILTDWGNWAKNTNCDCEIIREMFRVNLLEYLTDFIKTIYTNSDLYEEISFNNDDSGPTDDVLNSLISIIGGFEIYYEPLCSFLIQMITKFEFRIDLNEIVLINVLYLIHFSSGQNLSELLNKMEENDKNCMLALINTTNVVSKDVLDHIKFRILSVQNNIKLCKLNV